MMHCDSRVVVDGAPNMTTPRFLRRQASRCAVLAKETHDDESRQRFRQLEQVYLHLAETEEQQRGWMNLSPGKTEIGHAV